MRPHKLISVTIAVCTLPAMLFGCGLNKQILNPDDPAKITIWHYYNGVQQENFDHMLLEFNETVGREQGILVEGRSKGSVNELADNVIASLRQNAGAGPAPDMFAAYAETAYTADQLGCAVDLSQYFTEEELAAYVEGYLEEGRFSGADELKIFPTAKSTEVMMLNLTDWQTFADVQGITTDALATWEGLAETAEAYYNYTDAKTPDVPNDGKAFFGRDAVANYMIVGARQLGMEFFSVEDGSVQMHADENVIRRLWDCYYVPFVKGYYYSNSRYRSDDAKIGAIVAMVCSTTGAAYFPTSVTVDDTYTYNIEALSLPVPNFEGTDPYVVQQGAGMVVVKSDEKTEYACSVFLKWFTEKTQNIGFSISSGYLPVTKEANDFDEISEAYQALGSADDILLNALGAAAYEADNYSLYTAKPFAGSSGARTFLESYIQETAQAAHDTVQEKIRNGADRETAIAEYTSDAAFAVWYADFVSGLQAAAGE